MASIQDYLQDERRQTAEAIKRLFETKGDEYCAIDPTFKHFFDNLEEHSLRGGKMARSTLTRLAYSLFDANDERGDIVTGSAAVEMLHRFILAHDDIVDRDLLRHGGPSLEKVYLDEYSQLDKAVPIELYDKGMAMIGGDIIHALSYELVVSSGFLAPITDHVTRGLNECLVYTAAGWRLETILKQEPLKLMDEGRIRKAMMLVSAHYSVLWPLRIGQLFAGRDYGDWLKPLEAYGETVGLAFQIQDDVLGIFGDEAATGKPVGNDFREGKKTILLFKAWQKADEAQRGFLANNLGKSLDEDELVELQEIISSTGALEYAQGEARGLAKKGVEALDDLEDTVNHDALNKLRDLAYYLIERNT
jgi:geranylgeranyl pyrophosphate synthase